MALTPEENAAFYYGNPPPVNKSSWTDYINPANLNIFGQSNPMYESLLGTNQSKALTRQSNIAGLLGAAAAIAQGMGSQGPRRSATQNILSALGTGFGASGQAYQQGLQNFSAVQQLKANEEKQKAFAEMATRYPELAPLSRIDSAKFVEMVSQLEQQRPIAEAYKQAYGTQQPTQQVQPSAEQAAYQQDLSKYTTDLSQYKDQVNQMLGVAAPISGTPVNMIPGTAPVREPIAPLAAGNVEINPVPEPFTGRYSASMPQAPVAPTAPAPAPVVPQVNPQEQALREQKNTLLRVNSILASKGTKLANEEIKNNIEQIKNLDTQIQQVAVSGIDLTEFKNSLPENFRGQVDNLDKLVKKGIISGNEVRMGMQQISDKAADYQQKLDDRTNEVRRTAAELYPQTPLHKLDQGQMKRLNAVLLQRDKEARASGASVVSVYGDKVLAAERAKAQSRAEEGAINAQNAASDVRAIVDILKPYRGGALQDFAGSIGAYLPGTELEKLATARQAAEAIRAKLAPTLRVEGSGATSDLETKSFLSAIPSLINTAQGRELMAIYADKLAARSAAAADIRAKLVEQGTYSIKNFQQELAKAGLTQVFTPQELQILRGKEPATGEVQLSTPESNRVYQKYKPRP